MRFGRCGTQLDRISARGLFLVVPFASRKDIGFANKVEVASIFIIGTAYLNADDSPPVYSDSVKDSATSICSWDFHMIGQFS